MNPELITIAARSWIGTRFVHQGRVKKSAGSRGGCDCIGLIMGVAKELDIKCKGVALHEADCLNYSRCPDGESLKNGLDKYLNIISESEIMPGDVLLFRINKEPQHVAFAGEHINVGLSLIHSYLQARGVVEHMFDEYWQERLVGAYRF